MKRASAPSVAAVSAADPPASAISIVLPRLLPKPLWCAFTGAACALLLCVTSTWGATYRVGIGDDCNVGTTSCFSPSPLSINVGDSVEFFSYADTSFTGPHNVVADDGSFRCARGCDDQGGDGTPVSDSACGAMGYCTAQNWSFSRTFSVAGFVKYHDEASKAAGVIVVAPQSPFTLGISEIYSNADGSVQFIVLFPGVPGSGLAGNELVSSSGSQQNTYTFPNDAPNYSAPGKPAWVLVATKGFADLNLVKPDFIVPDRFLSAPKGSIAVANRSYTYDYTSLPTDGVHALYPAIDYDIASISYNVGPAVAVDNARQYAALAPIQTLQIVEYHNAELDEFFLTGFPDEVQILDAGQIPGWQRTGYELTTWTGPAADAFIIPDLLTACRVLVAGRSHFYSVTGCADALAIPGSVPETGSAFYATLPDLKTGICPPLQLPVFRLWNPGGTSHRYTTEISVRDDMLQRGFVSEGYGLDGVAMCVPGSSTP